MQNRSVAMGVVGRGRSPSELSQRNTPTPLFKFALFLPMKIPLLCLLVASWYGEDYRNKPMANGRPFCPENMTCAHRELSFGTRLLIFTPTRHVVVTVTDRGPFVDGRELDLSRGAFEKLADPDLGLVNVNYIILDD